MPPRPRPAVLALPAYSSAFAGGLPPLYRSSSNEAGAPPSPQVQAAIAEAVAAGHRYPVLHATDLVAALASRLGVEAGEIVVGSGSLSVLNDLLLAYGRPDGELVYSWRSYEAYPITAVTVRLTGVPVPNAPGGRHDLAAMAAAVGPRTVAVVVCTPNNPTGAALGHDEVAAFCRAVPDDVLVVLDRAYTDFEADPVRVDELRAAHRNVVELRTFSKAYGLAGLRVGYAVGDPEVLAPVRAIQLPFPVSGPAIAAARVALDQEERRATLVADVVAQRSAVAELLVGLGLPVVPSQSNFVWLPVGDGAEALAARCAAGRIAVRCFAGEGVRISVGEPGLPAALAAALTRA